MNTTFNSALKQSTNIRKDLAALSPGQSTLNGSATSTPTAAALGTLTASLTSFSRTIDEYNSLAKQELNQAKQEKAYDRIRNFRSELAEYRKEVATVKESREAEVHTQARGELLGRRPYAAAAPENPYASTSSTGNASGGGYGHQRNASLNESGAMSQQELASREDHAYREQNFFSSTNTALDEYIARGQAVLGDLNTQREMLKNTQKKLYSVANTLGVSGDTIRMVERRAREDKWIFWAGVVIFILFCWLVIHFLR